MLACQPATSFALIGWPSGWGERYPRRVWLPDETLARLLHEDGEAAIPTDR